MSDQMGMEGEKVGEEQGVFAEPKHFLLSAISGVLIFAIIATVAIGLSFVIKFLDGLGVDPVIIYGLKVAEYLLFFVDIVLFIRFITVSAWRHWRLPS